jgi:hypothetical protein
MRAQPSAPDFRWLESLPYQDSLELGAYKTAPGSARGHLDSVLREWSLTKFKDTALLIATELLTNSVTETGKVSWPAQRPPVRLWLRGGPAILVILTWDAVTRAPVPREARDDDENGRGLAIVADLSAACGYYYPTEYGGKVTWAIIDTPLQETFTVAETLPRSHEENFPGP